LDNYIGTHSNLDSLYKKIQRLQHRGKDLMQSLAGHRERKREEPKKEVAHSDFLLKEMQDMAQDFHSETYYKRFVLAQLAYEAQAKAITIARDKMKKNKAKETKVITGPSGVGQPASILDGDPLGADFQGGIGPHGRTVPGAIPSFAP